MITITCLILWMPDGAGLVVLVALAERAVGAAMAANTAETATTTAAAMTVLGRRITGGSQPERLVCPGAPVQHFPSFLLSAEPAGVA
jgi:hypothetical protein